MKTLPETETEIRAEFADRGNYFALMCAVNDSRGTTDQRAWCAYARKAMIALGYPIATATWSDDQTINYAQNIVAMG